MSATRSVLKRARKLVQRGWCQGQLSTYRNGINCYCATGAIKAAVMLHWRRLSERAHCAAERQLLFVIDNTYSTIHDWNDQRGRTKDEVLLAFDRAIEATP